MLVAARARTPAVSRRPHPPTSACQKPSAGGGRLQCHVRRTTWHRRPHDVPKSPGPQGVGEEDTCGGDAASQGLRVARGDVVLQVCGRGVPVVLGGSLSWESGIVWFPHTCMRLFGPGWRGAGRLSSVFSVWAPTIRRYAGAPTMCRSTDMMFVLSQFLVVSYWVHPMKHHYPILRLTIARHKKNKSAPSGTNMMKVNIKPVICLPLCGTFPSHCGQNSALKATGVYPQCLQWPIAIILPLPCKSMAPNAM